jgi:hypothetical protein
MRVTAERYLVHCGPLIIAHLQAAIETELTLSFCWLLCKALRFISHCQSPFKTAGRRRPGDAAKMVAD